MSYRKKNYKAGQDSIALLVRQVRRFKFQSTQDILKATQLLSLIFDVWFKLNEQYQKKLYQGNVINKKIYATYEVEEQIILGLGAYLNDQMVGFMDQVTQYR